MTLAVVEMALRTLVASIKRLHTNFRLIPDRFNVAPDPSLPAAADLRYSIFPILIYRPASLRDTGSALADLPRSTLSNEDSEQVCGVVRSDMSSGSVRAAPPIDQLDVPAVERDLEGSGRTPWDRPQWMEILFDLAWTATFSGLTSNTTVTGLMTLVSYAFFFIFAWWMWVSQMIYDSMVGLLEVVAWRC
ncbi:hypothetical protein EXIGLDRAFT_772654 [Exidia glandulosa HHB12029]|uniref:Uncharacterized protein n=1 Tax=Exidia glandulosa HHB12029 TaxID=1314781 RepID=A0A165F7R0_EXIGL|nr:hypothetical protein EXIGLDRAFT_772654 [Exidia glandulosa HHB12029]